MTAARWHFVSPRRSEFGVAAKSEDYAHAVARRVLLVDAGLRFAFAEATNFALGPFPAGALAARPIWRSGLVDHWSVGLVVPQAEGWLARLGRSAAGDHWLVDRPWPLDDLHDRAQATLWSTREAAAVALSAIGHDGHNLPGPVWEALGGRL